MKIRTKFFRQSNISTQIIFVVCFFVEHTKKILPLVVLLVQVLTYRSRLNVAQTPSQFHSLLMSYYCLLATHQQTQDVVGEVAATLSAQSSFSLTRAFRLRSFGW